MSAASQNSDPLPPRPLLKTTRISVLAPVMPSHAGLVSLSAAVNASARCITAWMNA